MGFKMLSLPKLLLLALVIGGVWLGFRLLDRRQHGGAKPKRAPKSKPLDMVSCATCGAWVARACARPDCPVE